MSTENEVLNYSKEERKNHILKEINLHTRVSFETLSAKLGVSEDTVRRDINELDAEALIIKVKGGAMTKGYHYSSLNQTYAVEAKQVIAQKAVDLLHDGMVLIVDGGTTIREFIRLIPNDLNLTVFTITALTAVQLLDKPNIKTIMIGGSISSYSQMCVSGEAFQQLASIKADLLVLGTNALDVEGGYSDSDWETVQVKKAMINASRKTAVLTITEKLNTVLKMKIANLSEVNYVITEVEPNHEKLQAYKSAVPSLIVV
ncbi:MAG: DeoR/GlpR family DNA-binding transcription regulator [Flavobacterium nitrogenifigens]|uniref:Transcriptional regulator, DeoR family n=1 Tax=Flavobacterium nitrogenifigens TaxID=1617283 RepID=A0A521D3I6_9FLAO|nr:MULTISPECIES: DeoR/GlpR family DNA-binding transcription regulator [Flavobacterium]KAF2080309.1 DeoR/GlpR transcriptional regulator [Flavobacterium sharifuzzamanii]KAF2332689.1 DeoR/GlpR transcriptional regulator [Flavobacterium nitrogenifigens]MDQ8010907.1 DeoR/GlpR family DNA-binding transcription regulator [Flavobacterium nitrogenifigens]WDF63189.1 DeoR/GlpR family DNA-binding transcription regulator [Flavobacterium sp. KACC 22763]SMO66248.1 transcriptional regulator, DeoR family [Flavob